MIMFYKARYQSNLLSCGAREYLNIYSQTQLCLGKCKQSRDKEDLSTKNKLTVVVSSEWLSKRCETCHCFSYDFRRVLLRNHLMILVYNAVNTEGISLYNVSNLSQHFHRPACVSANAIILMLLNLCSLTPPSMYNAHAIQQKFRHLENLSIIAWQQHKYTFQSSTSDGRYNKFIKKSNPFHTGYLLGIISPDLIIIIQHS